jgi:hypothetical protein
MALVKIVSTAAKIEEAWDVLQYPHCTVLDSYARSVGLFHEPEFNDLRQFTGRYKTGVTQQDYDSVAFMYACFNLLELGEDF